MKHSILRPLAAAVATMVISLGACADTPGPGYVDFGKFTPPSEGGEFVEVNINSDIIGLVAALAGKQEPAAVELLRGLKAIRVNVVGLDDKNRSQVDERAKAICTDLESKGWSKIVTAQQKDEDVCVYLKTRGESAVEGLVVTVIEGKHQAVFVNIVGDIRPERVAELAERMGIEPLKKIGKATKPQ